MQDEHQYQVMIEQIEQIGSLDDTDQQQKDKQDIKNSINFNTVQNTEWDHDNEVETSSQRRRYAYYTTKTPKQKLLSPNNSYVIDSDNSDTNGHSSDSRQNELYRGDRDSLILATKKLNK